jgi:hypothetical protein
VNNCTNTTSTTNISGRKRVMIAAAAVVTSGALLGLGAQGAFASTPSPTASGTATVSTSAGDSSSDLGSIQADLSAIFHGHVDGTKAQMLARKLTNDSTVFSLLPSNLQKDVSTLKDATPATSAADATQIAKKSLSGAYGLLIQSFAKDVRSPAMTANIRSSAD